VQFLAHPVEMDTTAFEYIVVILAVKAIKSFDRSKLKGSVPNKSDVIDDQKRDVAAEQEMLTSVDQ